MARLAGMEAQQPEVTLREQSSPGGLEKAFRVVLLAASVAGCAGTAQDKEQPLPKDAFPSFTAEWRSKGGQPIASAPALTEAEQKEFEDWRALQEWKRKNPK